MSIRISMPWSRMTPSRTITAVLAVCAGLAACDEGPAGPDESTAIEATHAIVYSGWSQATLLQDVPGTHPMFNTADLEGCPLPSRDGKLFFMASNRPGGLGGLDIWIASRASKDDPWGEPVNAGAPINSASNDFCPTLARDGHTFFFISNRPGGCGGGDIYMSRMLHDGSFAEPQHPGCAVNSAGEEASPVPLPNNGGGPVLYFSSSRAGGFSAEPAGAIVGDIDIYMSAWRGGRYQPPQLVAGVNSAADDAQPNVRRDGLELMFYSTRPGTFGGPDIYAATRAHATSAWSEPFNLGATVNTASPESRPSLSWDGLTLYFGSPRPGGEGSSDIYFSERTVIR